VVVPKKKDKIRVYMDFRDLNQISPKYNFPLPYLDMLVDNAVRSSTYSFYGWIFRIQSDKNDARGYGKDNICNIMEDLVTRLCHFG
jgi:hypothetical protein